MPTHFAASPARVVRWIVVVAATLSCFGVEYALAEPIFSVGGKETVYTSSQRKKKAASWPDGNFGVVSNGDGTYDFYAANSSKIKVTSGTLEDPAKKKVGTGKIFNVPKKTYNYLSGGPVYEDPTSGARLMVYHAEIHKGGKYTSVLGLAASVDPKGLSFYDLGPIVAPSMALENSQWSMDIGGGSFAIKDGQFNVYYRDYLADGSSSQLAVARAPLTDLVSNSLNGISTQFTKYYDGSWSQPGVGGLSSPLEIGNPTNWWSSVSYNDYLDQMVMVSSQWQAGGTGPDLYMATSPDGLNWSARQPLVLDGGEQMYPSIIGTGPDPQVTGQSFYVYYTDGSRWKSAQLARRLVTFDPSSPATLPLIVESDPEPGTGSAPEPTPMEWITLHDYKDDFQSGGPATGWQYAWNSNGKLGSSAIFSPLTWSESAQAYNTTGGATMSPGSNSHNDDYLQLGENWSHPGKPGYMPAAGYTIQEEDGAGLYRLIDSSIQKADSLSSKNEDGLGVLVYLNNTLLGPSTTVSTNGLLANFDRDLGQLNVGDTIWVMIDPLKSQGYDAFMNFDFSLAKSVPIEMMGMASFSLMAVGVPEPSSAILLLVALAGFGCGMSRRRCVR